MIALIWGIIGAIAGALYWKSAVYTHPAMLEADWIAVSLYAAGGLVAGLFIAFAISRLVSDK
jgi:hypothetical protein